MKKDRKAPFALVVDDNPVQNEISLAVLKKFGFDAMAVSTSKDFIQRLKELSPDLCLVDLNIESLGVGFTIIKAVRKVLGPDLPIFVVSGRYDPDAINHAMEIGADDYITKPLDREVLATKISRFIQTEPILTAKANLFPVPEGGMSATLTLPFSVASVDEFGMTLRSPHLLSKGAAVQLDSPLIHEITGRAQPALVTVQSTSLDRDQQHLSYVEFDSPDEAVRASIRKWLSKKVA